VIVVGETAAELELVVEEPGFELLDGDPDKELEDPEGEIDPAMFDDDPVRLDESVGELDGLDGPEI
jgi:hypothetical protein